MRDKMQLQRFELKYIIDEPTALSIRDFVSTRLELDEFSVGKPNFSYPVHSLYLDSDDLHLFQSTVNSEKNRYKLRLRFYSDKPGSPVFFEIKRRVDSAILKQRCGVKREHVDPILAGQLPSPEVLLSKEPKGLVAIQRFVELMKWIEAKPKVHVAYLREAWLPHDGNSVRITMDRNVRDDPEPTARLSCQMNNPVSVFGNQVVLEIKFTGRFPGWVGEMVRIFRLQKCSAAKYVDGICRMTDTWAGGHSSEFACKILGSVAQKAIETRNRQLRHMPGLVTAEPVPLLPSK